MGEQRIIGHIKDAKVIVFDLDGTIADLDIDWNGMKEELKNHFFDVLDVKIEFTPLHQTIEEISNKFGDWTKEEVYKILRRYELNGIENSKPDIKMIKFVEAIYKYKKLAIFSTNTRETIVRSLKKFDVYDFFGFIVGYEDVKNLKPNPEGLNLILTHFGVFPSEAVFIGNDKKDFDCGNSVDITTLNVKNLIISSGYNDILEVRYAKDI